MVPRTPDDGGQPTPMGTPVPGPYCPWCETFFFVLLSAEPLAKPAGPGAPCTHCSRCGRPIWVQLIERPPLARPEQHGTEALIPKGRTAKLAPTEHLQLPPDPGLIHPEP